MNSCALWALSLLLCCRLRSAAAADSANSGNDSVVYSVHMELWDSPLWGRLPHFRSLFSSTHTIWGRPIPGLATESECCGKINTLARIVGGSATNRNRFPWLAALVNSGEHKPFCGGSLINDRYVLTAAHCLVRTKPADLQIILGKHELTRDSGDDLRLDVSQVLYHPLFIFVVFGYDFGLVKLQMPLKLPIGGNLIAPICLPSRARYRKAKVTAAGWGVTEKGGPRPDRLQSVALEKLPNKVCGVLNAPVPVTASMVCATATVWSGGKDTCDGDSGGPLMVRAGGTVSRQSILGITSWGIGCARPLSAGVYARVTSGLDWVIANTLDAVYC